MSSLGEKLRSLFGARGAAPSPPAGATWLDRVLAREADPAVRSPNGDPLPAFPPKELQAATTGLAGRDTMLQAFGFYEDVLASAAECGIAWGGGAKLLDFGTGWGRVARLFLREVQLADVHGIDVDPAFAKLSGELFGRPANFTVCRPLPPTDFAPATFSAIVAYSVFSHLAPSVADRWVEEFARIVRPGGIVAFTTRDVSFLDYVERLSRTADLTGYPAALGRLFSDHAAPRAAYAAGEFVYATSEGVSGGGPRDESFYGEAFIPPAYVKARWARDFEVVGNRFDPSRYDQRSYVLRRR
jgi:SAM-dependent methyltransferase